MGETCQTWGCGATWEKISSPKRILEAILVKRETTNKTARKLCNEKKTRVCVCVHFNIKNKACFVRHRWSIFLDMIGHVKFVRGLQHLKSLHLINYLCGFKKQISIKNKFTGSMTGFFRLSQGKESLWLLNNTWRTCHQSRCSVSVSTFFFPFLS